MVYKLVKMSKAFIKSPFFSTRASSLSSRSVLNQSTMDGGNNDNDKHDSKHTKGKSSGTNGKHNEQWALSKENTRTKEIGFEWKGGALKSNGKSIKWSYVRKSWLIIHTHTHTADLKMPQHVFHWKQLIIIVSYKFFVWSFQTSRHSNTHIVKKTRQRPNAKEMLFPFLGRRKRNSQATTVSILLRAAYVKIANKAFGHLILCVREN